MDITTLMALLSPCLPFLMKLGQKAAESASGKIGEDSWNTAKKIWDKLHPTIEAKEDAKIAAQQLAAKPDSEPRKAVFQEELETLLKENPDLADAIAKIMQEDSSAASDSGTQNIQTVTNNQGQAQAINQMKGEKVIGRIDGTIHGGLNF
jgi:transketolase